MAGLKIWSVVISCLSCSLLTGCLWVGSVVKNEVNEHWPPITSYDQRMRSVEVSYAALNSMSAPGLAIVLQEDVFKTLAAYFADERLKAKPFTITGIKDIEINNILIAFDEQKIGVSADFSMVVEEYEAKLVGSVSGSISPAFSNDYLALFLAFDHLRLDDVYLYRGCFCNVAIKPLVAVINLALNSFCDNLNGAVFKEPVNVPLNLNKLTSLDPTTLATYLKGCSLKSKGIPFNIRPGKPAVLVNKNELLIISDIVGSTVDKRIANPAVYRHADKLTAKNTTYEEFQEKYHEFSKVFLDTMKRGFDPVLGSPANAILVTKKSLSFSLNEAFLSPNLHLQCNNVFAINNLPFSQDIQLLENKLPHCGELAHSVCHRDCPDCHWHDLPCKARRLKCLAAEKLCLTEKLAMCIPARAALAFINGALHLGHVSGELAVSVDSVTGEIRRVAFSEAMDRLSLHSHVSAQGKAWARIHVNPKNVGHLACIAPFQKSFDVKMSLSPQDLTLGGTITHASLPDGRLELRLTTDETKLRIRSYPSLYHQIVNDPGMHLNCHLLVFSLACLNNVENVIPGETFHSEELSFVLSGEKDFTFEAKDFAIRIDELKIGKDGLVYALTPYWGDKSLGFFVK